MPQFLIVNIVNESTEDTLESADNFQDARRLARQAAKQGPPGDPVSILGSGGIFFGGAVCPHARWDHNRAANRE
jgi:hypothetical protein